MISSVLKNNVKIVSNQRAENKDYYLLSFLAPASFKNAQPGQFVHIKISSSNELLLRRPLSINRIKDAGKGGFVLVEILYEVVGRGTSLLSEKKSGDFLNVLGPNGNKFSYENIGKSKIPIIICGGIGVAPLLLLAEKMKRSENGGAGNRPLVLIGARTKKKIICDYEFSMLGCDVKLATEDGGTGFKGKVTDLFKKEISKISKARRGVAGINPSAADRIVYACGPTPMLTELAKICKIGRISLQVSLEEFMGCGIGACLGCAVETRQGYKRVCKDGPVFNAEDIIWKF